EGHRGCASLGSSFGASALQSMASCAMSRSTTSRLSTCRGAAHPIVRGLFALRALLGRLCGWDADMYMHQETSSLHRLSSDITRRSALPPGTLDGPFRVLYVLEERV